MVTHENGIDYWYEYSPLTIKKSKSSDDLDQSLDIGVGDLGLEFPLDIDRLRQGSDYNIKPKLNYREYLMSDLTKPMLSILNLEVTDYHPKKQAHYLLARQNSLIYLKAVKHTHLINSQVCVVFYD